MACDEHFDKVVLLLPFTGSDSATTTTDISNSTHTMSFDNGPDGGLVEISTDQYKWGGSSLWTLSPTIGDTSGSVSADYTDDFAFGSRDFTIEMWVYWPSIADRDAVTTLISMGSFDPIPGEFSFSWGITGTLSDVMFFNYSTDGDDTPSISNVSWTPTAETWHFISITREGDTLSYYADGVLLGSGDFGVGETIIYDPMMQLNIGDAPELFTGQSGRSRAYFDDVRVTMDLAREHVVPTEAFGTLCELKVTLSREARIKTLTRSIL